MFDGAYGGGDPADGPGVVARPAGSDQRGGPGGEEPGDDAREVHAHPAGHPGG